MSATQLAARSVYVRAHFPSDGNVYSQGTERVVKGLHSLIGRPFEIGSVHLVEWYEVHMAQAPLKYSRKLLRVSKAVVYVLQLDVLVRDPSSGQVSVLSAGSHQLIYSVSPVYRHYG